jgi:hypothetical protein
MTALRETLEDFDDYAYSLALHAPDEIPSHHSWTYRQEKEYLCELWTAAKPHLKRDIDKVAEIDRYLSEGVALLDTYQAALDRGETPAPAIREKGRKLLWAIYVMKPSTLK